jgi:hypothetical protein
MRSVIPPVLSLVPTLVLAPALALSACSSPTSGASFDAGIRPRGPIEVNAGACKAQLYYPVLPPSPHVPEGTSVQYNTSPPCVGPHYPNWASFKEYDRPVDARYLVHSMEHGAIVLYYKCADPGECPDIVATLRAVRDTFPQDSRCSDVRSRIIIVSDPALKTRVAAAAWGVTYTAECADQASLSAFARDNYAKSPEDICGAGLDNP